MLNNKVAFLNSIEEEVMEIRDKQREDISKIMKSNINENRKENYRIAFEKNTEKLIEKTRRKTSMSLTVRTAGLQISVLTGSRNTLQSSCLQIGTKAFVVSSDSVLSLSFEDRIVLKSGPTPEDLSTLVEVVSKDGAIMALEDKKAIFFIDKIEAKINPEKL